MEREAWDEKEEETIPQEEPDWKRLPKEVEKRLRELLEEALSSRPLRKDEGGDDPSSPSS